MLRPGTNFEKSSVAGPAAGEVAFGLADAGRGLERKPAEQLQNAVAVAAAEREPDASRQIDAGGEHGKRAIADDESDASR